MKRQTKKILSKAALIAAFPAIIWAFYMASVAISHNSMGESFKDITAFNLEYDLVFLGLIWFSWFLPLFLVFFGVFGFAGVAGFREDQLSSKQGFLIKFIKRKQNHFWIYFGTLVTTISSIPASLLLFTAFDPGHYNGEFCIDRRAAVCEFDFLEMATFWGFWFIIPFVILFGLFTLHFLWAKKGRV